jgi:Flp pilus assembly pilin Flp
MFLTPCAWARRLGRDELGQDLIEYAVVAAFVSLMAVVCAIALNGAVGNLYGTATQKAGTGANFATTGSATTGTDCTHPKDPNSPHSTCK